MTTYQDAYLKAALQKLEGSERDHVLARAERLTRKWDAVPGTDPYLGRRWRELLLLPLPQIEAVVWADTEEGRRLRHTMPFAGVLSNEERAAIRAQTGMTLAHP